MPWLSTFGGRSSSFYSQPSISTRRQVFQKTHERDKRGNGPCGLALNAEATRSKINCAQRGASGNTLVHASKAGRYIRGNTIKSRRQKRVEDARSRVLSSFIVPLLLCNSYLQPGELFTLSFRIHGAAAKLEFPVRTIPYPPWFSGVASRGFMGVESLWCPFYRWFIFI